MEDRRLHYGSEARGRDLTEVRMTQPELVLQELRARA